MEFSGYYERGHNGASFPEGTVRMQLLGGGSKPGKRMEHGIRSGRGYFQFFPKKINSYSQLAW